MRETLLGQLEETANRRNERVTSDVVAPIEGLGACDGATEVKQPQSLVSCRSFIIFLWL